MILRYADPRFELDEEQILQDKEDKRDKRNQKRWKLHVPGETQISSFDDFMDVVYQGINGYRYDDIVAKKGPKGDIGWTSRTMWGLARNLEERFRITSEDVFVDYFNSNGMLKVPLSPRVDLDIDVQKYLVLSGPAGDFLVSDINTMYADNSWHTFTVVDNLSAGPGLGEFQGTVQQE